MKTKNRTKGTAKRRKTTPKVRQVRKGDFELNDFRNTVEFSALMVVVLHLFPDDKTLTMADIIQRVTSKFGDALEALQSDGEIVIDTSNPLITEYRLGSRKGRDSMRINDWVSGGR